MLKIAVVEDEEETLSQLHSFLARYESEHHVPMQVSAFQDGSELLQAPFAEFDIILMDIEMPTLNGMATAEQIRKSGSDVVIVFVTNMAHYAIQGYSVGALDYILKPVTYYTLSVRLERAIAQVRKRGDRQIMLTLPDGVVRLEIRQIYYVEIQSRLLHYHTELGEFVLRGTMQSVEQELTKHHFVRCNYWYLVNLMYVTEVRKDVAVVAGNELAISRRNRTAFMTALTNYVGGGA